MLAQLGKLVTITMPPLGERQQSLALADEEPEESVTPVGQFLQQMIAVVTARVREVRRLHPDRPVILIGWGVGAAVNCQVAVMEAQSAPAVGAASPGGISGLVCLGFPMFTLDGIRGEPDDPILELRIPILFVVGQNASQARCF